MLYFATTASNMWLFVFIGIAFFWIAAVESTAFSATISSYIAGVSYFFLAFDWAEVATLSVIPRIALACVEALFFACIGLMWNYLWRGWRIYQANLRVKTGDSRRSVPRLLRSAVVLTPLSACLWAACEQIRASVPFGGLPWGNIAFSLVDSPIISLASIGSTQLVSAVCVMSSICFGLALSHIVHFRISTSALSASLAIIIIMLPILIPGGTFSPDRIRIGVVQGNVPEADGTPTNDLRQRSLMVTQNHIDASQSILAEHPELIVWPESTSDLDVRVDEEARSMVQAFVSDTNIPIMLGTQRYFDGLRTNDYIYLDSSSAARLSPLESGEEVPTYSKQHPVPFGEYAPYKKFFSRFMPIINEIGTDMIAGKKSAQLKIRDSSGRSITVATPICFEIAYDSIVAEGAAHANVIVVPTSNYTFGYSSEAAQQFEISRFRAVEHGKTVVQVSTAGISGVISAKGVTQYRTNLFEQDARVSSVSLNSTRTYANRTYKERPIVVYELGAVSALYALSTYITVRIRTRKSAAQ